MCAHVCMCVHMCLHVCAKCACVCICVCMCVPMCACVFACVCICVHVRACVCPHVQLCIYVCAHVCVSQVTSPTSKSLFKSQGSKFCFLMGNTSDFEVIGKEIGMFPVLYFSCFVAHKTTMNILFSLLLF